MKIIYQNIEYTLQKLKHEQMNFEKSLEVPNYLILDGLIEFFCFDPEYKLAVEFCRDLYNQITSARFALILGHKKLHDSNYINWESDDLGQYWLRFQYLKNSINWYNSSFDILLQVIWFGFALYRIILFKDSPKKIHDINSTETFNILLKKCRWKHILDSLKKVNSNASIELLHPLESFYVSEERKKINNWSNSIKHHGRFIVNELYRPSIDLKVGDFNSENMRPTIVKIDNIVESLEVYHKSFCKLVKYVFDFFNFNALIPDQKNDKIPYTPKNAKEFKKIIIK